MKSKIPFATTINRFLGRRRLWRIGRAIYMTARLDIINDPRRNGEENLQLQLLAKFAKAKERLVVFDVGANIGDWTYFLLQEVVNSRTDVHIAVHSFEPVPSTFDILLSRISNHINQGEIYLRPLAISSKDGTARMYIYGEAAGTNSLHSSSINLEQKYITVEKSTLDSYCTANSVQTIHYLKCDAEGHDMEVILGAEKLFTEQRILACQFEYNHHWIYSRHYLKDVFDLFSDTPYRLGKITPKAIELHNEWHPELERFFESNYIILHPIALNWFRTTSGYFDNRNTYCADSTS